MDIRLERATDRCIKFHVQAPFNWSSNEREVLEGMLAARPPGTFVALEADGWKKCPLEDVSAALHAGKGTAHATVRFTRR